MSTRPLNRRAVSRQVDSTQEPARRARRHFFNQPTKRRPRRLMLETLDERRVLATMYATTDTNSLLTFDSATPNVIATNVAITGLGAGELIQGLDVRPATGQLYALGITDNGATRTGRILTIDPTTAAATVVGTFSTTLSDTDRWGFDFNPTVDRIRVVSDNNENLRVNPNNGALAGTDTTLAGTPFIEAVAYDRNVNSALTTLYAYNFNVDELATIGGIDGTPSPNLGAVSNIGSTGLVAFGPQGFDIESGTNIARFSGSVAGVFNLYTINLATGAATLVNSIGAGGTPIHSLATGSTTAFLNGTTGDDSITLVRSGGNVIATGVVNGPVTIPLAGLTNIQVSSLAGNDTLTLDFSGGALPALNATVENVIYAGTAGNDTLAVSTTGVNAFSVDFNSGFFVGNWAGLTSFGFNGIGGNDNLSLTYNAGGSLPTINYDGGAGGLDTLTLGGPLAVTTVTHNFTNANDGSVNVTGQGNINYTGLDPIIDNLNAVNRIFNFTGGLETVTLGDNGVGGDNVSRIQSTLGELVDFLSPTATLTVNLSAGTGADTLNINPLDILFAVPIGVNLNNDGNVVVLAATTFPVNDAITVNGGAGDDTVTIAGTGHLEDLLAPIVVNGNGGSDTVILNDINHNGPETYTITNTTFTRTGGFGGLTYGTIENLRVDGETNNTTININSTAAGTAYLVNAGIGADTINVGALDNILGTSLTIDGQGAAGEIDTLNITDTSTRGDEYTLTGTTLTRPVAGFNGLTYSNFETLNLSTGDGNDIVNVTGTSAAVNTIRTEANLDEVRVTAVAAATQVNIDTGTGFPGERAVIGAASFAVFNTGVGTLANIQGEVNVEDSGGQSGTFIDNSGDPTNGRTFNFDDVGAIPFFAVSGIALTSPGYLLGSINVGNAATFDDYQFADGNGSSTHNIDLDIGYVSTSAQFFGNAGDDVYNLNINNAQPGSQPEIIIHGNGSNFAVTGGRDVVNINENFNLGAVNLGVAYTGAVGGTEALVTGLGRNLRIDTSETIRYVGNGNDNTATVTGTPLGDDLISVTPVSANRVLVFNGGNPFDGPPEDNATSIPGISGGSVAADLDLSGLLQATGLNIQDNGATTNDRLYVYGESEADLVDGRAFDPFGFGAGVIMNGVAVPASYDVIAATDTFVQVDNLVRVNFDNADFVQADPLVDPAVVVNAGFETTNSVGTADDITVTPSPAYKFQINGGDPDPVTTGIVPPNGDRLTFGGVIDVVNVWATKDPLGGPPVITLDFPGSGNLPVSFSSIEDFGALTANTVNLIGDNNDPAVDQNDDFVVVGRNADNDNSDGGYQEFQLFINNSVVPLSFNGVQFLNVFGDDQNPPPGTPSTGNDIDTLEITPYADDTPRGWGIDVSFNEGNPAGADGVQDLLILHTSLFGGQVSENIVIKPAGPDNGEIIFTNASFGTPIVDIDFVANTDIIIRDDDGFVNDTDTLTLLGTNPDATQQVSGNETFDFNADAAMTLADPLVTVTDTNNGNILYRLREFSVNAVGAFVWGMTIDGQSGNDTFNLSGGATLQRNSVFNFRGGSGDDSLNIDMPSGFMFDGTELNFDGGTGSDLLTVQNSAPLGAAVTTTQYFVGSATGSGRLIYDDGVLEDMTIDFVNLEPVIDLVASNELIVTANNADNAINYSTGAVATNGLVSIDDHEVIEFSNKFQLTIEALAGSDTISLQSQTVPTGLTTIEVNGGDPTASDKVIVVGTTGIDTLTYTPTDFNTATLAIATRPTVNLDTVEHVIYDSGDNVGVDVLTINGTTANDTLSYDAGLAFGGTHRSPDAPDFDFLRSGRVTFNGNAGFDVVNYLGSDGVDTVTATATAVTLATPGSTAIITFGTAVELLNLSTFAGNDSITLTTFAGAPTVVYAGDGNDTVLGSTLVDSLYGGAGNDILVGGGGDDFLYGEEGNDIFGNPSLTPNGVADDPGADSAFGGEGFDNFVWEPGDGADLNNGGGDGADIFRFFGNAAANTFTLRSGGTATHFNALIGALVIDNHGIEDVVVDGQGGGDTYTVDDLFATEVVSINLVTTAGAADTVTLNARNVSDNISLASTTATRVAVTGLRYNVNVDNAASADGDILIVNGNDGDDSISSPASLLTFFTNANLRLNGGLGNDTLVGNGATITGGLGNDSLTGGVNNDFLDGSEGDDTFVGGGGTDNIGGGAAASVGDSILVNGTNGADTINLSLSATGQLVATVNGTTTTYNNFAGGAFATSGIEQIFVQGQAGNDSLTVNSANGAVPVLITYDGGNNNDTLTLTGGTATSDTYTVGSTPDRGTSVIVIGGVTQTVGFLNIEPMIDLVAGPLTVIATNADNAINYGPGTLATNGLVSVDGFETIEFSNKTTLTINALAGEDTIAINPVAPTGLTGVTVNGGNPGAGDTLIITGSTGTEAFEYAPTLPNAGTVTIATFPVITFGTISAVTIDGGSTASDDTLVVRSEAGGDTVTLTPGANFDSGTVDISSTAGTESTPRLTFLGLGQDATLTLLSGAAGAREDEFVYNGTASSDTFGVSAAGAITLNQQIVVNANGAIELRLNGLNGDDLFTVPGNHPFAVGILVDGGNPSAGSDVLNFNGAGAAITVNLPTVSITETGFGPVSYLGVEDVAINGGAAALTVNGTTADDRFDVQPTAAGTGSLKVFTTGSIVTASPQFTYTNVNNAAFTLNGDTGFDDVHLLGNNAVDTITATAATITRNGGTVTFGTALERVDIDAFDGNDNIDLTTFASVPAIIRGGLGDDTIVGSTQVDLIYGGSGNDLLRGGGGADTIYGEDGNDTFGIVSAVAQDAGGDFFFGGDGSDLFIWNPGDGNDLFEGGAGEADRLQFQGNAAANTFIMNAVDTRLEFLFGAVDLDLASTEEVQINTLGGGDTVTINDLDTTEVRNINVDLFVNAGDADTVTINGRNVSDSLSLAATSATRVAVTGLKYAVNVDNPLATDGDILIVNGNDGNDNISSPASLLTFFTNANLRLNGNVGNDNILGNGATMVGGAGDDFITGGVNNDFMDGSEGDDTFVGGGGTDNVGGGAGSSVGDTILVAGTSGVDAINLSLSVTGQLVATVNGATTTYNNFVGGPIATSGIEQILVQAQNGNDGLTVNSANGAIPILVTYDGGANNDLLTLVGGVATSDTYSVGPDLNRGTSVIVIGGVTQQVSFLNIEPVIDLVGGPLLVLGTNSNNNITYTQGPNVGAPVANSGLVAIDGFETIEFGNKTALTINALLGNDNVTLANTGAAAPTGLTQIIVSGGAGDDVIDASSSTVATPLRLYGDAGNDTLVGGLAGDALFGGLGNDTLVDSPGNDAYDGGNNGALPAGFVFPALPAGVAVPAAVADPITATGGFDIIVIRGTGGNDVLAATQGAATAVAGAGYPLAIVNSAGGAVPAATADVITTVGAADVPNALASRPSVEEVRIEAGNGNDEIIVAHSDSYVAATGTGAAPILAAGAVPQQMVRFDVRGDSPNASDRLTVQDLGLGDLVLLRQAADQRTGRVTVAPAVNATTLGGFLGDIVYTGIEKVNITPINPLNGGTGTDGLGQVVVFDTDPFEYNDNILNAEDIAHIELVTRNPNIDPGHNAVLPVVTPAGNGDEDWYAFTAPQNGTFQINTLFSVVPVAQPNIPGVRPGLPGNGQLVSALYNAIGAATAPLVVGSTLLDPLGQVIGQQLQFTAIEGRTYYLRVIGTNATPTGLPAVGSVSTSLSVNTYDISLAQIDNVGPQVFDPDGSNFPAQAIQIVDAPLYNLFDNKQTFNSTVLAAPAPTLVGGVLNITSEFNLVGMQIGETVTFTTGVNAGLSDTITAISGNRLTFGSTANPTIFALPAAGDAFFVGAPTPTPNVNGLTINFRDPITAQQFGVGPGALLGALDPATALNPGNYILRGDANGIIPIQNVRFAVPANGVIGGVALPDAPGAGNTTITLNAGAGLSVVNGPIVGQTLQFTSGLNTGLSGRITGYNAITGSLRFSSAFPFAITAGDAFIISPSPIVISPVPVLTTANVTAAGSNVVVNLGVNATTGAGLSNVPGTYVGQALQIISGALAGETRTITAYNGAGVFTVAGGVAANGFSGVPAVGDVINIVGTPATATSTVGGVSLANSIVGGAGLPLVNGQLVGQALQFTSGPLSGQARVITGYTIVPGIGPVFAFATGFTAAPAVGNSFVIVPAAPAPLANAVQAVIAGQGRFVGGLGGVAGAGLNPLPQAYLGQVLQFTSGALTGQAQVITDYANNIFAFSQPFTANPAVGDTFVILPVNVAAITLDFESPLPDDRYTLTISDEIRDVAGNQLDGNTAASQPTGSPIFPSGDGISGGDFVARFTVDSRPELGTWAAGSMWADINGNQLFDPNNTDFTNRDYAYLLGYTSDELFAGNFANVGATFADGFDKIAAYGRVGTNTWRWLIDTDNDGVPNITQVDPASINGFPVSGDFDLNTPGDEVGLFTGTTWFLDINHNFILNDGVLGVRQLPWTFNGVQVNGHGFTGDFDGDGAVDLGSWSNDVFSLSLSSNSGGLVDGIIDTQFSFGFPGNRERPVAADMNRDGIDDIGLWVPDRATQTPGEAAEWYWLVSGLVVNDTQSPGGLPPFPATLGPTIPERVVADPVAIPGRNIVAFTPTPFGNDLYMQFGDEFSLPIVGNFDPPVEKAVSGSTITNTNNPLDVNNDGKITAFDALAVINSLNLNGTTAAPTGGFIRAPFLDVNGNGQVTAFDALQVINYLNLHPTGGAAEFVFENDLAGGEDTSGIDDELLMLLAADEDRD